MWMARYRQRLMMTSRGYRSTVGTNEVTVTEGATSFSADLSALEESADIAANTADIASNTADIATNTADIATNTADIATNTSDIATNTSDIATNTADIATNTSDIATNTADIATNTTDIATNTSDIATNAAAIALKEDSANKSTDVTLSDATNTLFPTELAVKTYVDGQISATADDDITGVSFNGGTNEVTVTEGATSFSADLSALEESADIAANTAEHRHEHG